MMLGFKTKSASEIYTEAIAKAESRRDSTVASAGAERDRLIAAAESALSAAVTAHDEAVAKADREAQEVEQAAVKEFGDAANLALRVWSDATKTALGVPEVRVSKSQDGRLRLHEGPGQPWMATALNLGHEQWVVDGGPQGRMFCGSELKAREELYKIAAGRREEVEAAELAG